MHDSLFRPQTRYARSIIGHRRPIDGAPEPIAFRLGPVDSPSSDSYRHPEPRIIMPGTDRPPRIVVVEDDWFMASESEAVLVGAGCEVVGVAGSADEAMRVVERERPDLVLMDIRLSDTRDGVDIAIEIRRRLGIPCLYVTAYSDPVTQKRGEAAAPAGWLFKPYRRDQLVESVRAALARLH